MDLHSVLRTYRTFDPAGWVGTYRAMPTWLGICAVVLGVALLLFGGGRLFRVIAGPIGAVVGFLWAPIVALRLGLTMDPNPLAAGAAATLGVAGFALPASALFMAAGIPAGLFAGDLAGNSDFLLGFIPGFVACGTVAAFFTRQLGSILSALIGAWMLVLGALAALHRVGGVVAAVAAQPWVVVIAAGFFAVAGAIYQLFVRPSPEEAEKIRLEKVRQKKRAEEQRELEKRWAKYGASPSDD